MGVGGDKKHDFSLLGLNKEVNYALHIVRCFIDLDNRISSSMSHRNQAME